MIDPYTLPDDLPAPVDDGAADHLSGLALPDVPVPATDGRRVSLARLSGRTVVVQTRLALATPVDAGMTQREIVLDQTIRFANGVTLAPSDVEAVATVSDNSSFILDNDGNLRPGFFRFERQR